MWEVGVLIPEAKHAELNMSSDSLLLLTLISVLELLSA